MSVSSATKHESNEDKEEPVEVQKVKASNILDSHLRSKAERALTWKLDLRLMPMIALIFIMNYIGFSQTDPRSFMDRTAVTAARLKGMEEDLGLTDLQYDTVVAILYVSYCPMQIPSNMILNKVSRPSLYIGTCVVLWGITSTLTGITHNYAGIMLCRVFIGLPEAAFYPGAIYLLSRWYTRKQLAFRSALLYCGLLISNAFGSLMAAGILSNMEGKRGIRAWRWLFFIEGSITIVIGFMAMFVLPDYPHNTRWLSASELHLAQVRLAEEAGEADHDAAGDSAWTGLKMAIMDIKVPLFMIMTCSQLLGLSFVNFFPTLAATLGFSTTISLLMAAPPWILAAIICMVNALHADKTGERFLHITGWWWAVILGYIISLSTMAVGGRYFSMFLMASGYAGFALTMVWVSNAIPRPPAKRAAAIGLANGFGNIGNLIGSFIWKAQWGPKYHQSMLIALCALVLATALSYVIRQILVRENRALDVQELVVLRGAKRERVEEFARLEGITFEEALVKKKGFRYLY
ncbi:major facilitator superfamily domain-containing protein [Hysterangium stoloniferum]|nr:major facilitator superfamily domain-containing protein [Hysterangium stoloniferum]